LKKNQLISEDITIIHNDDYNLYINLGHSYSLQSVTMIKNRYVAVGTRGMTIVLWDVQSGDEICNLLGHQEEIDTALFSANGQYLISSSWNGTLKLWDLKIGKEIYSFSTVSNRSIDAMSISDDGKYIVIGYIDDDISHQYPAVIKLYDIEDSKMTHTVNIPNYSIMSLFISKDNKFFISSGYNSSVGGDGVIKLWDLETSSLIEDYKDSNNTVFKLAKITFDNKYIVAKESNKPFGKIKIWAIKDKNIKQELNAYENYQIENSLSISQTDNKIVYKDRNSSIKLYDLDSGEESFTYVPTDKNISSVTITSDDKYVLFIHKNKIGMLSTLNGEEKNILNINTGPIQKTFFFSKRGYVYLNNNHIVIIWDLTKNKLIHIIGNEHNHVKLMYVDRNDQYIIYQTCERFLKVFDIDNGSILQTFYTEVGDIKSIMVMSNEKYIIVACEFRIIIWDITTGLTINKFEIGLDSPRTLKLSRNEQYIIYTIREGYVEGEKPIIADTIVVLKINSIHGSGTIINSYRGLSESITKNAIAITPDNKYIVAGDPYLGKIRIWSIEGDEKKVYTLSNYMDYKLITIIDITSDSKYIISNDSDGYITKVDIENGDEIYTIKGNSKLKYHSLFELNGEMIICGSEVTVIKFWRLEDGRELNNFSGHKGAINSVYMVHNSFLITESDDRTIKVWDINTNKEIVQIVFLNNTTPILSTPKGDYMCSENTEQFVKFVEDYQCSFKILEKTHPLYKQKQKSDLLEAIIRKIFKN